MIENSIEEIEKLLTDSVALDNYITANLPKRLHFMTEEKRLENIRRNLTFKLIRLRRELNEAHNALAENTKESK